MLSSSSPCGGGGHWSDGGAHDNDDDENSNNNTSSAAAASEVFRDFTWYSAMLLSHLFALEHAQLVREAQAEEVRRQQEVIAHSPQLLMRAAMDAATAAAPSLNIRVNEVANVSTDGAHGAAAGASVSGIAGATERDSTFKASSATPSAVVQRRLAHLTTQHRPHILLGFTWAHVPSSNTNPGGATHHTTASDALLNDPATRWTSRTAGAVAGAAGASEEASPSSTVAAATTTPEASIASLLAVFDTFYFPEELFRRQDVAAPSPSSYSLAPSLGDGSASSAAGTAGGHTQRSPEANLDGSRGAGYGADAHAFHIGAESEMESEGAGASGSAATSNAAPRVTPEALREAFHVLLLLGQRCAAFALTYNGIVGTSLQEDEGVVPPESEANGHSSPDDSNAGMHGGSGSGANRTATATAGAYGGFSSEDDGRGGFSFPQHAAVNATQASSAHAALQQAASASLQFLLQLACNCPCASLAYAAQLCLAHALTVQPPPRHATGWAARHQLLRFLPTLQAPSRAVLGGGDNMIAVHHHAGMPVASGAAGNAGGAGAATAVVQVNTGTMSYGSSGSGSSNRVPATQYIQLDDPLLWFDATGTPHVITAQKWWEAQTPTRAREDGSGGSGGGGCRSAYCGPLPSTTALPTVQRLLMEEEQYMGSNGSAAAVLKTVMEAVSTEVTLNARVIPGGAGGASAASALVHTSLRRRRGLHGSGSGSPRTVAASAVDGEGGSSGGSPVFPGSPISPLDTSGGPQRASPASTAANTSPSSALSPASTAVRLSKAAKRRRALLFALAQSHLLPPTSQLAASKTLLYGVFTDGGECPSYYKLLSLYPGVLRAHHAALHYVLFEDGPLPVDARLMIATMAASRHRCEYLVSRFSALLLRYAEETMQEDEEEYGADGHAAGLRQGNGDENEYGTSAMPGSNSYQRDRHGPQSQLYGHHGHRSDDDVAAAAAMCGGAGGGGGGGGGGHTGGCHRDSRQQSQPQATTYAGRGTLARQRWITHGPSLRLRAVQHFIAIAAHTPWIISEDDIRAILAAGWTIPEVFQLVAIVAQVIPLCGFVMGLFVPAEPWTMTLLPLEVVERLGHRAVTEDAPAGATATGVSRVGGGGMMSSGSSGTLGGAAAGLRRGMHSSNSTSGLEGNCPAPATPNLGYGGAGSTRSLLGSAASTGDMAQLAMRGSSPNGAASAAAAGGALSSSSSCPTHRASPHGVPPDVYRRYAGEDSVVSEQRIKGSNATQNPHTLWRSQFTWNELGATSMEQYYPGAATLLNEEIECFFDVVRQLTKADCVGLMSPDYAPSYAFRSLQLYVQNLLGFMVEDYPYNDINKVLRRPAKWFAQVLTMRPETLTRSEVVRWYVPTTPPTGKASPSSSSDMSAESSLVTHQLKREIELLSVVDSAQGGHRGGIESASAHPDPSDALPPTPAEAARDAAESEALQTALTLQDERVLLLIALATTQARKEGLLHILLRPVYSVLSNM